MVKESNIFIGLKKTCLGVLDRGNRNKDNETGLKKGGGIEMSTAVLPLRDARSLSLCIYLPCWYRSLSATSKCRNLFCKSLYCFVIRRYSSVSS